MADERKALILNQIKMKWVFITYCKGSDPKKKFSNSVEQITSFWHSGSW